MRRSSSPENMDVSLIPVQMMKTFGSLMFFLLSRPRGASGHQGAQLPAVLPLPLAAETHPGRSEGAGAAGPPPAGPGGRQGAAQHPADVLQGHVQPPDAGEQRQLLLAVQ